MHQQVWILVTAMKFVIISSFCISATSATNYTVGRSYGWSLDSDVQTWSSTHTFHVGDTLVFLYRPVHNVLEVNESAYEACVTSNPISVHDGRSAIITLNSTGKRFFICGRHCDRGLKVEIVVSSIIEDAPPTAPDSPNPSDHKSVATTIAPKFVLSLASIILMIIN
ncbi:hypothetical protein MKW92_051888 [Papaver armeniacum]|nr:hypothetical protein MKW92_051888 [Papaver armeniacum]